MATPPLRLREQSLSFKEENLRSFLTANSFQSIDPCLQGAFVSALEQFPIRFLILDDSGSMGETDGHRLRKLPDNSFAMQSCSRWEELGLGARFLIDFLQKGSAPCEIRLLNGLTQPIRIGMGGPKAQEDQSIAKLLACFNASPRGGTPLCQHVGSIVEEIRSIQDQLLARNEKALVIIATDGESSDGDLSTAMKPLERLPVHVVVRLCTNNDSIMSYWEKIDSAVELELDILDDVEGEAREVELVNPWLAYNNQLHLLRTLGHISKDLDLLDERALSPAQLRGCLSVILGCALPDPLSGWPAFASAVENAMRDHVRVWSPTSKSARPVVDLDTLARAYSSLSGAIPLPPRVMTALTKSPLALVQNVVKTVTASPFLMLIIALFFAIFIASLFGGNSVKYRPR